MNIKKKPILSHQTKDNFIYSGVQELWLNEAYLQSYNKDIVRKLSLHFSVNQNALEFGAGLGTLSQLWQEHTGVRPSCVEVDPNLITILQERGFQCFASLDQASESYDLIYSSNVLEHIEDDQKALKEIYDKLKPGGVLALYLPAKKILFSTFDESLGHFRRYEGTEIIEKLIDSHYRVLSWEYSDSIGFFAWLYIKIFASKNRSNNSNERRLQFYDRYLYPISSFIDSCGAKYFLGKNLLVYAYKE